jgi:hypothetical protein
MMVSSIRTNLPTWLALLIVLALSLALGFTEHALAGLTLAQSALLSQNELQRGVLETFVQESVLLDRIPLMPIEGNAYAYNEEATLPGVEFRAVNAATPRAPAPSTRRPRRWSSSAATPTSTRSSKTRGNVNDQRAMQDQLKVKAASYKFQDAFINGDTAVDANSFDGLKKRLTGGQVLAAGTNGGPVVGNGGTDIHAFFDFLDALIALGPRPQRRQRGAVHEQLDPGRRSSRAAPDQHQRRVHRAPARAAAHRERRARDPQASCRPTTASR